MYYDLSSNLPNRDMVYKLDGSYVREVSVKSGWYMKKAIKKRTDITGKKCGICFTIKSLSGNCECD